MYKRISIRSHGVRSIKSTFDSKPIRKFRSFGYYVLGGSDMTGEHTSCTARVINDTIEDFASGCSSNALCDPRVGFWDMAQKIGVANSKKAQNTKQTSIDSDKKNEG